MAKSQRRSTREIRKPKAVQAKPVASATVQPASQVAAFISKSKGKL
jgi:hypothetical protein